MDSSRGPRGLFAQCLRKGLKNRGSTEFKAWTAGEFPEFDHTRQGCGRYEEHLLDRSSRQPSKDACSKQGSSSSWRASSCRKQTGLNLCRSIGDPPTSACQHLRAAPISKPCPKLPCKTRLLGSEAMVKRPKDHINMRILYKPWVSGIPLV